jgi:hypothetical protein
MKKYFLLMCLVHFELDTHPFIAKERVLMLC